MNNEIAIDLISSGALTVKKMLVLCEEATNKQSDNLSPASVVHAFVREWNRRSSLATLASNQSLIDAVAGCSSFIQAYTVHAVSSEWSKEDFGYAFQKLSCEEDLFFIAGPSGKYTQEEVFKFGHRYCDRRSFEYFIDYWTKILAVDILDAEGLYELAVWRNLDWPTYSRTKMDKLVVSALSKRKMNGAQVRQICALYASHEVIVACIQSGVFQDEELLYWASILRKTLTPLGVCAVIISHIGLADRSIDALIDFGDKADNDDLWLKIIEEIKSRETVKD